MVARSVSSKDLTKEKSLLSLYVLSFKFPASKFNLISTGLIGALLFAYLLLATPKHEEIASNLREIVKFGIALVPSVLGFLIAGFTVFVTVTKSAIFVHMAKLEYEDTGESYLKYNLSAFMLAFAHYIAYLSTCMLTVYFGQPNGPITLVLRFLSESSHGFTGINIHKLIIGFSLVFFGMWTWYLLMLLKSFIYNTYQVVTTTVRWEIESSKP